MLVEVMVDVLAFSVWMTLDVVVEVTVVEIVVGLRL